MKLLNNRQAEHALEQKLRSYFKVPKTPGLKITRIGDPNATEESPVVHFEGLEEFHVRDNFYCVQCSKLSLDQFLVWDKFEKSGLYEAYKHGEGCVLSGDKHNYRLSVYLVGHVWMISKCPRGYDEVPGKKGGIVLSNGSETFLFQPVKNYLEENYELPE